MAEDFKIEKGVPLPAARKARRYPFPEMEPGDSFAVTLDAASQKKERDRIERAASTYGRRHGKKFATRLMGDTVRVWRVS